MRLLNILIIAVLILSASFVYKIKFDSTLQAEKVAKIGSELRRERDATARLRAEWARLDTPERIQGLADRHLKLKGIVANQLDMFDNLPERPLAPQPASDAIANIIGGAETTGSISGKDNAKTAAKPAVKKVPR